MWTYIFKYEKIWINFGNCPIMRKVGWLGQFRWQIWVSHQISYKKRNLIYNFVKFSNKKYLATKWSWYLGLCHIYIYSRQNVKWHFLVLQYNIFGFKMHWRQSLWRVLYIWHSPRYHDQLVDIFVKKVWWLIYQV